MSTICESTMVLFVILDVDGRLLMVGYNMIDLGMRQ